MARKSLQWHLNRRNRREIILETLTLTKHLNTLTEHMHPIKLEYNENSCLTFPAARQLFAAAGRRDHTLTGEKGEEYPNETKCSLHVRKKGERCVLPSWWPCMIKLNFSDCVQRGITGSPTGWKRRGVIFGYQMSKQCYPRLTRCSTKICLMALRLGSRALSPLSGTRFFKIFFLFLKGVEATEIVLNILPNKREHTQAGAGLTSENPLLFNSCSAF